jgi:UDP-N-acetyl-D-galactosamine dehydrogenase
MDDKIAIVGLGYVGLPLGVAFIEKYILLAFDINQGRVNEFIHGRDS